MKTSYNNKGHFFETIAQKATQLTGTSMVFTIALSIIFIWILTGPLFNFSDTWQLVINTGTTIITFLMVFLIQRTQNKDSRAIHLKLNELIASLNGPSNRLVDIEDLTEDELTTLHLFYQRLARLSKKEKNLSASHSIDEACELHKEKYNHFPND